MSSAPFMQLYVSDYLGDTQHLTTEQHGSYLLLLMAMWRNGGFLPNDEKKLARIARVNPRRWHILADDVMAFFDVSDDEISQKRLVSEYQKVISISEKRSASGKLGGSAKALKSNKQGIANAKQMPKHSYIPDTITINKKEKKETIVSQKKPIGTRLSADWCLSEQDESFAINSGLIGDDLRTEEAKFRDHWAPKTGKDATKLDWSATWRNWVRNRKNFSKPTFSKDQPPKQKSAFRQHQDECRAAIDREIARIDGNEHSGKIIDLWATTG